MPVISVHKIKGGFSSEERKRRFISHSKLAT
jgi:hypothetical protein